MNRRVEKLAAGLAVVTVLWMLAFTALHWRDFHIETDLAALAPDVALPDDLRQAVSGVSAALSRNAVFLLRSDDIDQTEMAWEAMSTELGKVPGVRLLSTDEPPSSLLTVLQRHRFQLLTSEQRALLQNNDPEALTQWILAQRFSASAAPSWLPFAVDPFAWHSAYAWQVVSQLSPDELPEYVAVVRVSLIDEALAADGESPGVAGMLQALTRVAQRFPEVQISYSGLAFHANAAATHARNDISRIGLLSSVGIVLLMLWVFRSWIALTTPVLSIVLGVAFASLVTQWVFGGVHVIAIVFGASLIGVVVDYSLHYYFHALNKTHAQRGSLHRALLLSLLTSVVGYAALMLSSLKVLSQVAVFSCAGLVMAMVVVLALAPKVAERLTLKARGLEQITHQWVGLWQRLPSRFWPVVFGIMAVVAGIQWQQGLKHQDNPASFFALDQHLLTMEREVADRLAQYEPGSFVLVSGESVQQVYDRSDRVREQLGDGVWLSLTDALPSPSTQRENHRWYSRLYQPQGAVFEVAQAMGLPSSVAERLVQQYAQSEVEWLTPEALVAASEGQLLPLWWSQQGRHVSVALLRKGTDLSVIAKQLTGIEGVTLYRALPSAQRALFVQKRAALTWLVVAFVVVAAFLLLVYQRVSALGIVAIPLSAVLVVIAGFGLWDVGLSLFHVMALFLVLGLGLDYGIFVREMRRSLALALPAVSVSAVTSLLSFGLLALSSVPVVQGFGLTLMLANSVNFLGSLIYAAELNRNLENE